MPITAPRIGAEGEATLADDLFGSEFNEHLVWHVVRTDLASRRQGSHATRTRGMVRGGGAKPWRQKGTGRARQGTRRAPQWAGGGVVFGPSPRSYGGKVNRKERLSAIRSALSLHGSRGSLAVLANDALDAPSTRRARELFTGWRGTGGGKLLVVCTADQENVWKSFRNLPDVMVVAAEDLDVADIMWARSLVISEAALESLPGGR